MSGELSNVFIVPPSGNAMFSSYESVVYVYPFINPERILNFLWLEPDYCLLSSLVDQYVSAIMILGNVSLTRVPRVASEGFCPF